MKIGVLSDTHMPKASKKLPQAVLTAFKGIDLIIHAGDIVKASALEEMELIAPVVAVHGNRDSERLKQLLPEKRILELDGYRIGIFHGHGAKGTTMDRLPYFFNETPLDCVIFGHSHIPYSEIINGVLYFNPGSPTVKKKQKYPSVGILTLGSTIDAQIVLLQ